MNIPVSSAVQCRDGSLEYVASVITDPDDLRVTHLVLTHQNHPCDGHIVPISMIERRGGEAIQFECTASDIATLRRFNRSEFVGASNEHPLYAPHEHLVWRYTTLTAPEAHLLLPHQTGAARHVVARQGDSVYALDGFIGQVEEFVVHTPSQRITHLALSAQDTPERAVVHVPIEMIGQIVDGVVYLSIGRAELAAQPSVPVRCCH